MHPVWAGMTESEELDSVYSASAVDSNGVPIATILTRTEISPPTGYCFESPTAIWVWTLSMLGVF